MNVINPCCDAEYLHVAPSECGDCHAPQEHHQAHSTINLDRGKWSFIVMGDRLGQEIYLDASGSITEAIRTARQHVGWRRVYATELGNPSGAHPRKGLAYGILIEGPFGTATIIPTPRHTCVHGLRSTHHPMYGKCVGDL